VDENGSLGRKKRIKEKEKWKRNYNEKIFLLISKDENIRNTDSRVKVEYAGKHFGKYRNRPKFKYLGTTRNKYQKSRILYEE